MDDLGFSHPELRRRFGAFLADAWSRSWVLSVVSASRSEALQREWYRRWLLPPSDPDHFPAPVVADPDRDAGMSPWGWRAHGSMHMIQGDGWSHAVDLGWRGPTAVQLQAVAWTHGLRAVEPSENWHFQFWDPWSGIFPTYGIGVKEDSMRPKLIRAIDGDNAIFVSDGIVRRWIQDGWELQQLVTGGLVDAIVHPDGSIEPYRMGRSALDHLAHVGPPAVYADDWTGPRTL